MARKSKKQKLEDDEFLKRELDVSLDAVQVYHDRAMNCNDPIMLQVLRGMEYYFKLRYEALLEGRLTL